MGPLVRDSAGTRIVEYVGAPEQPAAVRLPAPHVPWAKNWRRHALERSSPQGSENPDPHRPDLEHAAAALEEKLRTMARAPGDPPRDAHRQARTEALDAWRDIFGGLMEVRR